MEDGTSVVCRGLVKRRCCEKRQGERRDSGGDGHVCRPHDETSDDRENVEKDRGAGRLLSVLSVLSQILRAGARVLY